MQNNITKILAEKEAAKLASEGVRPERTQMQLYFADQCLREEIERFASNGTMPKSVVEFADSGDLEITMSDECRIWLNQDCSTIRISNGEAGFYYHYDTGTEREQERFDNLRKQAFKLAERWYKANGSFTVKRLVAKEGDNMKIKKCELFMNPEDREVIPVFYYARNDGTTSSFLVAEDGEFYGMDYPEDLPELMSLHDQGWYREEANNILQMADQRIAGNKVIVEY